MEINSKFKIGDYVKFTYDRGYGLVVGKVLAVAELVKLEFTEDKIETIPRTIAEYESIKKSNRIATIINTKGQGVEKIHIDVVEPLEECENISEGHGVNCMKCNACGRFNKLTQKQDGLKLFNRLLNRVYDFPKHEKNITEHQRKIWKDNIEYFKQKIKNFEEM